MATLPPIASSNPKIGAPAVVSKIESNMPRTVLDFPNKGRPSKKLSPASNGKENRGPKIFFAMIGVPFANAISASNCAI
jgi:hypothetical protein